MAVLADERSAATEAGQLARPLRVLSFAFGQDTGGWGYRVAEAFRRHAPGWDVRAWAESETYLAFKRDLTQRSDALSAFQRADVLHAHNTLAGVGGLDMLTRRGVASRKGGGDRSRGVVLHHHGSRFRAEPKPLLEQAAKYGALQIVSTIDLQTIAPDVLEWMPSPYELDELQSYRRPFDGGRIRIGHSPTNRAVKSTELFLDAVRQIQRRRPNVELVLVERQSHEDCLTAKGTVDVFYDQLILGYGNNAIEAWGMGIPVVCGVADPVAHELMLETWGELPFYEADRTNLQRRLEELIDDEELRRAWGARGFAHVSRWHDARNVVPKLADVYQRARLRVR